MNRNEQIWIYSAKHCTQDIRSFGFCDYFYGNKQNINNESDMEKQLLIARCDARYATN